MPPKHRIPSPNRFLARQRRDESPPKSDKSTPAPVKHSVEPLVAPHTPVLQQLRSASSSSQFVAAPRFSVGKSKAAPTQRSPSPEKPLVQALRSSRRPADEVEDASANDGGFEMLGEGNEHVVATTESHANEIVNNPEWASDVTFSPKRRRLDHSIRESTSTKTEQRPLTAADFPHAPPRFSSAQPGSSRTNEAAEGLNYHRPAFLRASAPPQEPSEPLPETFSPHKRGQKFVPGGMAATVQQWVIETGQAAIQSRRGRGYLRGEDYVARVSIDRAGGHGPFVVQGKDANMQKVDLLLAGRAEAKADGMDVDAGSAVGLRAPTWDIELEGRCWTVAVDWKVLS